MLLIELTLKLEKLASISLSMKPKNLEERRYREELDEIKQERLYRAAREDINTFTELVMRDQRTGKPFVQAEMHRAMQDHVTWCLEEGFFSGIMGHWGCGKCLSSDTTVVINGTGEYKNITEIKEGDYVLSLDKDLKYILKKVKGLFNNGKKTLYKIKTKTGREIKATSNHPFLTKKGWTKLYNLTIHNRIAVPRKYHFEISDGDHILWDEIKEIEEIGIEETYNLEIEGTHNFIANDIFTHNTSQLVIPRTLDFLGKDPNKRIKIVCNIEDYASQRVSAVKQYIERSEEYNKIYPNVNPGKEKIKWGEKQINVKRTTYGASDYSLEAGGIFSAAISGRCDILIADDITDYKNSVMSPTAREKVIESWDSNWKSRLEPEGFILYVSTPWHEKDCSYRQLDNKKFSFLILEVSEDFTCILATKHYWTRTGDHEESLVISE